MLDTKKPAFAGRILLYKRIGTPEWTRTTDPYHVKTFAYLIILMSIPQLHP
ncbi:MAG: hypothetical protein ACJAS1_004650 [Oleiphilaceae bacterium]